MAVNNTGNANPNFPSRTGNPSGGGRGNNPPSGGGRTSGGGSGKGK